MEPSEETSPLRPVRRIARRAGGRSASRAVQQPALRHFQRRGSGVLIHAVCRWLVASLTLVLGGAPSCGLFETGGVCKDGACDDPLDAGTAGSNTGGAKPDNNGGQAGKDDTGGQGGEAGQDGDDDETGGDGQGQGDDDADVSADDDGEGGSAASSGSGGRGGSNPGGGQNGGDSGADAGTCPPDTTEPNCLTPCTRRADCAALCTDASDDDASDDDASDDDASDDDASDDDASDDDAAGDDEADDCSFFCNANGVCVHDAPGTECTAHEDCTRAGARLCADGHCVSCLPTDPMLGDNAGCADGILCRTGDTPRQNTCEECVTHDDCDGNAGGGPEFAECHDGTCVVCSAPDNLTQAADSCPAQAPYCDVNDVKKLSSCVSCLNDNHCAPSQAGSQAGGGVCTPESVCIPCDPDTHDGCTFPAAWCLPGETPLENTCSACDPATHGGCVAPTPQCLEGDTPLDNTCVACIGDDDCTDPDTPFCDQNTCIACRSHADCTDPNAARCDAGVCTGCNDSTQCAGITGTEVCFTDEQRCVQCTKDETSACGDYVCDTRPGETRFTCSEHLPGGGTPCDSCVSDAQCVPGSRCVLTQFQPTPTDDVVDVGYHCLLKEGHPDGEVECETSELQYVNPLDGRTSLDGDAGTYCYLTATTCAAYRDYKKRGCADDADCGLGIGDGRCEPFGSDGTACTYRCTGDLDCESTCSGFRLCSL